jgi:hypothetical protein
MISYLSYSVGISGGGLGQEMDKEIVKLKEQHAKQNPVMQVAAATSALGLGPAASALGLGPATSALGLGSPAYCVANPAHTHSQSNLSAARPHETTSGGTFSGSSWYSWSRSRCSSGHAGDWPTLG